MSHLVSIIIPTKNAGSTLESTLKSIKLQSYKHIEIIVVDNFSTDNTLAIASKYTKNVYTKGPERSIQRNFGVTNSKGEYIAWFDADMALHKDVIKDCVEQIETNKNIAGIIIPEKSVGTGFWAQCRALEKQCYLGDENIEGLRFIKRDIFKKVGMFSANFISGEDWDITIRVRKGGYEIGRIKNFVLHNEGNLKLLTDLKKKYYYATKSLPYVDRHINGPRDIVMFIFRPAYIKNWKLLLRHPFLTVGMLTMKVLEFAVGFIGILRARNKKS